MFTILSNNGFGQLDATIQFGFIGVRERPVAADMDQDGIDDIGLWVPDRAGQNPQEAAEWYTVALDQVANITPVTLYHIVICTLHMLNNLLVCTK